MDPSQARAVAGSIPSSSAVPNLIDLEPLPQRKRTPPPPPAPRTGKFEPVGYPTYLKEYPETSAKKTKAENELPLRRKPAAMDGVDVKVAGAPSKVSRKPAANSSSPRHRDRYQNGDEARRAQRSEVKQPKDEDTSSQSIDDDTNSSGSYASKPKRKQRQKEAPILADPTTPTSDDSDSITNATKSAWEEKVALLMKNLPKGVDDGAAKQIFNEIVVQGDEVHWDDVAGLEIAKKALKEAVVYPFLRPDLFMGLREPARGMLLFGPPGTGKTMLARAVATESRSTFFSISASSLTSKYLGESEKLVRALFSLAKALAPSIIFVDEIDSLLSARSGSGEHEATRRIKTEFLIQWSDLQRAAAGREQSEKEKERGDASRVLVLAATNLPWAIDEAARRRFVRRQYIPLPENETRAVHLRTLLGHQKHSLDERDIQRLVRLTNGFSGSDITALAKDAAMGPLRSLGEALLHMSMDQIRPIQFKDFEASLVNIRPSVSKQGLKEFEDWAKEFGERGG
jgi:SpoVK/Ycf46/Vps4 family AAA+-type ATPase